MKSSGIISILLLVGIFSFASAWGGSDKVLLKDVQVLTLNVGQFTNGRRHPGVPQIKCVGGTAGCGAFVPQVVQCKNMGFDGSDYQWECKADMDNAFKFGRISVSCEGYDYPDDPYVLKGSCGLEYTIDLTTEGYQQKKSAGSSYGWNIPSDHQPFVKPKSGFTIETIVLGAGAVVLVYAVYRTCIAPTEHTDQRSRTNDDYPSGGPDSSRRSSPPPPGFRSDYYSGTSGGDSCSGAGTSSGSGARGGSGFGGFWTGAATGGLLGYMFGNSGRNAGYNNYGTGYAPRASSSFFGGGGDSWGGGGYRGGSSSSSSSGSRTASGFGGTTRR